MAKKGQAEVAGRVLALSSLVVLSVAMTACNPGRNPEAVIARVHKSMASGDLARANVELRQLIQAQPGRADARVLLARLLATSGDATGAELELRRALELGHPKDIVYPALAGVLLMAGKPAKVVEELASHEPADLVGWADLKAAVAEALALTGKLDRAREVVRAVLQRVPGHVPARLVEVRLLVGARDVAGARALLDQVLSQDATQRSAWRLRGDIELYQRGDHAQAAEAYERVVALAPKSMDGHVALITAQIFSNDLGAAAKSLDALRGLAPQHPQTRFLEAHLAFGRKDYARARELASQLLKYAPQDVRLLQLAGAAELQLGALVQAESLLGKSVFLAPDAAAGRRLLASTLVRSGRPQKALELLRPLLDRSENDVDALGIAGEASVLSGQFDQAGAYFERALKLRPADARLRTSLALTRWSRGDPDRALSELSATAVASDDTAADLVLITKHLGRGDFDAGLKAIDVLERKQPGSAQPPFLRGRAHALRGDDAKARAAFDVALQRQAGYFPAVAGLALLDVKRGEPAQGRRRLEEFVKLQPANDQGWIALAGLAGRGRAAKTDAQAVLERAVAAVPDSAELRVLLANHLLRYRNVSGALGVARAAQAAFPARPDVLDVLGRSLFASGDTMQAMKTFAAQAALQPSAPLPLMRQVDVLRAKGELTTALATARRAHEIAPNDPVIEWTVISLALRAKLPDKALQFIQDLKRRHPDSGRPYVYEGDLRAGERNWEAALAAYRAGVLKADAGLAPIRLHATLLQLNRSADGNRFADEWWRKHPRDAAFAEHLGDVAMHRGDDAVAERWYRQTVDLAPDRAKSLNNLAWTLLKQDKPGAGPYAERAVALVPEQNEFLDTLATVWSREGQAAKALEVWKVLVERAPQSPTYRLNLLRAVLKSGDKSAARVQAAILEKQSLSAQQRREFDELRRALDV